MVPQKPDLTVQRGAAHAGRVFEPLRVVQQSWQLPLLLAVASVLHVMVDGGGPRSLCSTVTSCVTCQGWALRGLPWRPHRGESALRRTYSSPSSWVVKWGTVWSGRAPWLTGTAHSFLEEIEFISASQTAGIKPSHGVLALGSKHLESPR